VATHNTIHNELQNILGNTLNWPINTPYAVPDNYFINLTDNIIIAVIQSNNAEIPKDYFNSFSDRLMQKIHALEDVPNELETVAPTLLKIGKPNPYQVAPNYFEQLQINVPSTTKKPTKFLWLKPLVAAASVLLLLSIGIYFFIGRPSNAIITNSVAQLQQVAEANNIVLATIATEPLEKALDGVQEEELFAYLDTHAGSANFTELAVENTELLEEENASIEKDKEIDLDKISNEEIESYLNN
jgi:hypothetical protein